MDHDKLMRKGSTNRGFLVRECYEVAHSHMLNIEQGTLWTKVLPTREKLGRQFLIVDRGYILCEAEVENCLYLFKHCLVVSKFLVLPINGV